MKLVSTTITRLVVPNSLSPLLLLLVCLFFPGYLSAYTPPIGIPEPSFGIDQTHTMYEGQSYDYDGDGTPDGVYGNAGNGPYTHYVDMNSVSCIDSGNSFGTQTLPRCTFPDGANLKPGAVVEIHGGTYINPAQYQITSNGTPQKPIFFRGVSAPNKPVFERVLRIRGSYLIIENIDFNKNNRAELAVDIRPDTTNDPVGTVHHIALRYCEAQNYYKSSDSSNGALVNAGSAISEDSVHDIVYYKNKIHPDNLVVFNPPENMEFDLHGIGVDQNTNKVWVLENEIYNFAGDGVGNAHGANYTAKNLYIGGNDIHSGGENAVDLKEVDTAVISSNKMHDFQGPSAGSDGSVVVLHYGPTYSPKNAWVINNEIYDASDNGIQVGGSQAWPVYIVGNVIHDIHNTNNTANGIIAWTMDDLHISNNTISNVDNGIDLTGNGSATSTLYLYNNIISGLNSSGKHLSIDGSAYLTRVDTRNNLIYQSAGGLNILWGTTPYTSIASLQAGTGKCTGCIQTDPWFIDAANKDFRLKFGSQATDKALSPDVYTTFQSIFGLDLRQDKRGTTRPCGLNWDIGAHETPSPIGKTGTSK